MSETGQDSAASVTRAVVVRTATRADRPFIEDLARDVFSVYGSYDRYLSEWFDTEGVVTLVAECEGHPVGLVMLMAYPNRTKRTEALADLLAIAVRGEFQTKGVGTILLQRAVEVAPTLDAPFPVREIHLSVAEGNVRAQRLFSRQGFRFSRDEGIYPAGQRALHMIKELGSRG